MKINVGVIFGGESVEHEVSIISAIQAMKAIDDNLYNVIPIYVSKKSQLFSSSNLKKIEAFKDLTTLTNKADEVYLLNEGNRISLRLVNKKIFHNDYLTLIDVIIPIMHGTNGEDGVIQGYLEMLKIPYAGCDVIAAGVGQDKVIMKYVLAGNNLPICDWFWFYGHEFIDQQTKIKEHAQALGYPLIIKPACLGSSIGIQFVHNPDELSEAVNEASKYDRKLVVEKVVNDLMEINCSVLGDCYSCQASSLEQVLKTDNLLSFSDKYIGKGKGAVSSKGMASTSRIYPAQIDEKMTTKIKSLAIKTFMALGASGVCRIDFLVDTKTNDIYVNEINTIPGSLAFYLWQDCGVDFTELMNKLIKQAIDRQRRREKMIFSYESNILAGYNEGAKGKGRIK